MTVHGAGVIGHGLDWVAAEIIRLLGSSEVLNRGRHGNGVERSVLNARDDCLEDCCSWVELMKKATCFAVLGGVD